MVNVKNKAVGDLSSAELAALNKGKVAYENEDYTIAFKELEPLALKGNAIALNYLGLLATSGDDVGDLDKALAKAAECFKKAADQGYAIAQCNLGVLYECGRGVPEDVSKAIEYFQKSAAQGYADAQFKLALRYENGNGVPLDKVKAFEWYQKAATQGDDRAQFNLAVMYEDGDGVPKDLDKATEWYKKAEDQRSILK